VAITEKTRQDDEKLREELRHADIGKLKKLMAPLIERNENSSPVADKQHRRKRRNR
jgi:hypothetical protein